MLREELQSGFIATREIDGKSAWIFVVTSSPEDCLNEITRLLRWIGVAPMGAASQPLQPDPWDRVIPIGKLERLDVGAPPRPNRYRELAIR
jgi:hypothetical protein